ncbi:uncharacterized protein [Nicotiana tomentosiformis]|uniref:uncharacterized protein n=1 Tax=Nicotiana tomentosiformis TaxID=4098 RepID=UPI00388CB06B
MVNPYGNPSSPPKETIPTPSITPSPIHTSNKGRFKMITRKVVDGGEQIKKINEQLKASRAKEPQKSKESFKCVTEGEETVSSEIKQGGKHKNKKGKESEGAQFDMRGMGKGVAESSHTTANKKRKAASSIPVETPPTRGRAKRSQKKQSEAKLEKALEESKIKSAAKGKKKVVEPVEAVEI